MYDLSNVDLLSPKQYMTPVKW